jgi:hypothetical protein
VTYSSEFSDRRSLVLLTNDFMAKKSVRCEAFLHTIHGSFAISETAVKNIVSQNGKSTFRKLTPLRRLQFV